MKPAVSILALVFFAALVSTACCTAPPSHTATIIVRGFDQNGASSTGMFGVDVADADMAALAATIGLPMGDVSPDAPNQAAYCDYYGTQHPPYYTQADIDELNAVTTLYGGGIPRYALIVAKFAREVMRRSGAQQVNLLAVSMGGLVSRWIVEKDVGGLVSAGKVARWIPIEGVVCGNWIASQGSEDLREFIRDEFDLATVDIDHMHYDWVTANLHNPRNESANPLLGLIQIHYWIPSDDDYHSYALSLASEKPNDGVVLLADTFLHNLPPQCLYLGRRGTRSCIHATHESSKDHMGIRAGIAADLFGRRRVTITLSGVVVRDAKDSSGNGEYVFGLRVYSPQASAQYGITSPIHQLRARDANVQYFSLPEQTSSPINLQWFDDMVLPGETSLVLQTDVTEVDYDLLYDITENPLTAYQDMKNGVLTVSTTANGTYQVITEDWGGDVVVSIMDYPAFDPPPSSVAEWQTYE